MIDANTTKEFFDLHNKTRRKNRFLVEFPKVCGIHPELVSKFDLPGFNIKTKMPLCNMITVHLRWYFKNKEEKEQWFQEMTTSDVISLLNDLNNKLEDSNELLTFKEFNETGAVCRVVGFTKPQFINVSYSEFDYKKNEPLELRLCVFYDKMLEKTENI